MMNSRTPQKHISTASTENMLDSSATDIRIAVIVSRDTRRLLRRHRRRRPASSSPSRPPQHRVVIRRPYPRTCTHTRTRGTTTTAMTMMITMTITSRSSLHAASTVSAVNRNVVRHGRESRCSSPRGSTRRLRAPSNAPPSTPTLHRRPRGGRATTPCKATTARRMDELTQL